MHSTLASFKCKLCKNKTPVKKGFLFPIDYFKPIIEQEILPFINSPGKINVVNFRSLFQAIIIYFTFCRFDDFHDLQDQDFIDHDDFIEIVFRKSKNDQYHKGTKSVLVPSSEINLCPVMLTRLIVFQNFQSPFPLRWPE